MTTLADIEYIQSVPRQRRTVEVSERVPKARKGGRQPRLWAYGYADLAVLLGWKVQSVRQAVARGRLDPGNLVALARLINGGAGGSS